MSQTEYIDSILHDGIVVRTDLTSGKVIVKIIDDEADCGSCPAAVVCSIAGNKSKELLEIPCDNPDRFRPGEKVRVSGSEKLHQKAIILAIVIPCAIMLVVMTTIYLLTASQLSAALGGLGSTAFFFILLYLMRDRVRHEFIFSIDKLEA